MKQIFEVVEGTRKVKQTYHCKSCDAEYRKWVGRCSCGEWNTLEIRAQKGSFIPDIKDFNDIKEISGVKTGIEEFDRVLDGGIVPGSLTLLSGEPGIGKSTLILQIARNLEDLKCLLVTSEESQAQVAQRAKRIGVSSKNLTIVSESDIETVENLALDLRPDLLMVDSVQTMTDFTATGQSGSPGQVRSVALRVANMAKQHSISVIMVGQITKDGSVAGPKTLEHIVDTVLFFEGDRQASLRWLSAKKHRFGSTEGVGLFEMGKIGLIGVSNPERIFLNDRPQKVSGSVIVSLSEGKRPIVGELQALVSKSTSSFPKRSSQGLDSNRLSLVVAVLEKHLNVALSDKDIFVSLIGGIVSKDPALDLGIALAIASSHFNVALNPKIVALGEVGLSGEIRQAKNIKERLIESFRLKFDKAIVPANTSNYDLGMELVKVSSVEEAVRRAFVLSNADKL